VYFLSYRRFKEKRFMDLSTVAGRDAIDVTGSAGRHRLDESSEELIL
jgi:hypothetical protein